MTNTEGTRLQIVENEVKELKELVKESSQNSREFHKEMRDKIDLVLDLAGRDRVKLAALEERVNTNSKIIWTALGAGVSALMVALFQLINK